MSFHASTSTTVGRLGCLATMLMIIGANEIRLELVQTANNPDRHHQIEGDWTHDVTILVFLIYAWTLMRCVETVETVESVECAPRSPHPHTHTHLTHHAGPRLTSRFCT